jgi:hypothetical protein
MRPEGIPEEVKLRVRVFLLPASVLAVHYLRFVWMHFEAAHGKSVLQRCFDSQRLCFRSAVYQSIVSIAAPGNTRKRACHPDIERIVQKEIGEDRTDYSSLRSSLGPFDQVPIRLLQRSRQPSSYVKPHPFTLRVLFQRLGEQRMVYVVK